MTTRPTVQHDSRNPAVTPPLPTGYSPGAAAPDDFFLPSCGIGDADEGVFDLFETELGFTTREMEVKGQEGKQSIHKPSVIFSTGERFAVAKRLRPIRDSNKAMMLPTISIHRPGIQQTSQDIMGRGRNQMTGEFTIKRKLDSSDRDYQTLVNKMFLQNVPGTLQSRRPQGENKSSRFVKQGKLLAPNFGNNVYEIITLPAPQFFTAKYEVVFWSLYMEHMNYMIETLFGGFLPQGKEFIVKCEKGYWFRALVGDEFESQDNTDDFTNEKKLLRYSFTLEVHGFMLAPNGPGNAVPFRRHISAPTLSFEMEGLPQDTSGVALTTVADRWKREDNSANDFLLSDIELDNTKAQTPTVKERFEVQKEYIDPVTGRRTHQYIKLSDQHQTKSETSYKASDSETLAEFLFPDKRKGSQ